MPEAHSCFFDFTERSDSEGEAGAGGTPPGSRRPGGSAQSPAPTPPKLAQAPLMDHEGKGIDIDEHPWALEEMARQFASQGWVHIPQLGVPLQCRSKVKLEAVSLQSPKQAQRKAGGLLSQGMTNMADSNAGGSRARTDSVIFIDFHAEAASAGLRERLRGLFKLDQIMERVVGQLATQLQGSQLGLCLRGRSKMMFARYEPGGYYLPHIDADEGDDRVLTAVYYLNQDWRREDGGALRLQPSGGQPHVDVWPEEDTLVLFRADEMVHEVCRSSAQRLAVTIWFKGVCGQVHADTNGTLHRLVPLRRLPGSLQPSLPLAESMAWHVGSNELPPGDPAYTVHGSDAHPRAGEGIGSSDSDDDGYGGKTTAYRGPVLVCWNIVGFRLQQGAEKLAGLFWSARRLGIKDHVVLSYPEDHGIEGEGEGKWREYVESLIKAIDRKPRHVGRPLLLWAHSAASAAALSVAWRLGSRVLKVYMVDGYAPEPGGYNIWAGSTADFKTWSDAKWILTLASWNPGSTVLREMATAVMSGWDVSNSRGAQSLLAHGKRQYLNSIHPNLARDVGVIPAPILAFSMSRDDVIVLGSVLNLGRWTSAGFCLERFEATHMGWLEPTADKTTSVRRCGVFDQICEDMRVNLEHWKQLELG